MPSIIIEGPDAVGKSTLISETKKYIETSYHQPVFIIHCENFKNITDLIEYKEFSKNFYKSCFELMNHTDGKFLIFDRCHLGEYVYSPMYRHYDGSYIFELENKILYPKTVVEFLIDADPEKIIEIDKLRNDGKSFTLDIKKKNEEIKRFKKAFEQSSILNKKIITNFVKEPKIVFNEQMKELVEEVHYQSK